MNNIKIFLLILITSPLFANFDTDHKLKRVDEVNEITQGLIEGLNSVSTLKKPLDLYIKAKTNDDPINYYDEDNIQKILSSSYVIGQILHDSFFEVDEAITQSYLKKFFNDKTCSNNSKKCHDSIIESHIFNVLDKKYDISEKDLKDSLDNINTKIKKKEHYDITIEIKDKLDNLLVLDHLIIDYPKLEIINNYIQKNSIKEPFIINYFYNKATRYDKKSIPEKNINFTYYNGKYFFTYLNKEYIGIDNSFSTMFDTLKDETYRETKLLKNENILLFSIYKIYVN